MDIRTVILYTARSMKPHGTTRFVATAVLVTVFLLAGCNTPRAKELTERRSATLKQTVQEFKRIEDERPEKLARTGEMIREQHDKDVTKTAENGPRIKQAVQDEFDRWRERQNEYRKGIERELKGDPHKAAQTLPEVLF